ncbi:MAG: multicopper oxidase family protein [Jiangellaceae bacterium]|nr:multicopper oxidase family protein [Jiangellaceae bacterium]
MQTSTRFKLRRPDRLVVAIVVSLAILVPLGWIWVSSLVPGSYSVMAMGYPDRGGGRGEPGHGGHSAGARQQALPDAVPVTELTEPRTGPADVAVTLVARQEMIRLASGQAVEGYTLNHSSPGPEVRARQGELVEVTLVNESISDGVSLHWHGVDVPNAEDGVAGVTQDAVPSGGRHVYRFVAEDAGTFWYHSHQVAHEQVRGGLFGVLVVEPATARAEVDVVAAAHSYGRLRTVNGATGETRMRAAPGAAVRVRVVNTDNGPIDAHVLGAPFRVLAIDGHDLLEPDQVEDKALQLAAGGRADLGVRTPADGSAVRVQLGAPGGASVVIGPDGARAPKARHAEDELDLLSYGSPAELRFDPADADRHFEYSIGRRPGFLDGIPGLHWSINGHVFPDIPMFTVTEGDIVRMTLENHSGEIHPMHLHGHHAVVLSRNDVAASGSPWWVDSLDVADGDSYEIAFVADNPGIWTDHCHNLAHAREGLVAHLGYTGVSTPFQVGGTAENQAE